MDIKAMRYFISAAENLSFTQAAVEFNVTQTAISVSVSKAEEEIGFQLFTRNKRSLALTEAGRGFYERIVYIVRQFEEAINDGLKTSTGKVGEIRIGVPDSIIGMSLVSAYRAFREAYPQVILKSTMVPPHKIMFAIASGAIDVAIGFPQEFEPIPALEHRVFRHDKPVVVMAPEHELAGFEEITMKQLSGQTHTIIYPASIPMVNRYVRKLWSEDDFEPKAESYVDSIDDALLEVAIGDTITVASEHIKEFLATTLVFRPLDDDEAKIPLAMAWEKKKENAFIKGLLWVLLEEYSVS